MSKFDRITDEVSNNQSNQLQAVAKRLQSHKKASIRIVLKACSLVHKIFNLNITRRL